MNDRQWQQAWEIFHAIQALPDDQRRSHLASIEIDAEVRREIASLLDESAEDADRQPESRAGTQFGRYEIGAMLGSGGMGQVYSAHDIDLDRMVAVKFLSPELASSPLAVERLMLEAKAASALNHPHIVTVYEVSRSGDDVAIAMELVEGVALRTFCGARQGASRVIPWGRQIAQALAAAHGRNIIHRDIKPENVMVREDGIVKVLDFGLARHAGVSGASTNSSVMLAGTLHYMSPEQCRGEGATSASDIFSLGVVLYELAYDAHPFRAESAIDTAHAILHSQPGRSLPGNPAIPPPLQSLLRSMLEKEPLKRPTAAAVERQLNAMIASPPTSTFRRWAMVWGAAAVLFSAGLVFWFRGRLFSGQDPVMTQLTTQVNENRVTAAAISPDGRNLAFAAMGSSVSLRRVNDGVSRPLPTPAELRVDRIAWFSDQPRLLLSGPLQANDATEEERPAIWIMPIDGGQPDRIVAEGRDAAPSPDGKRITFTSADRSTLLVTGIDGSGRRQLRDGGSVSSYSSPVWSPDGKRIVFQQRDFAPAPDRGSDLAYLIPRSYRYRYESVDAVTGRETAAADNFPMTSAQELRDGRLLFVRWISVDLMAVHQLWEVRTDPQTGRLLAAPRQLTHLAGKTLDSISASSDGKEVVATIDGTAGCSVYLADLPPAGQVPRFQNIRRLTFSALNDFPHAWTPDLGSVIFESDRDGRYNLFRQRIDRRDPDQITASKEMNVMAQITPDGQWILYHAGVKAGFYKVMRVRPQGGTPEAVTPQPGEVEFRCAARPGSRCVIRRVEDNQYVFYELDAIRGIGPELARTALTPSITGEWDISPDGGKIAIPVHSVSAAIRVLQLQPGSAGGETRVMLKALQNLQGVVWAADGSGWFVSTPAEKGFVLSYADHLGNTTSLLEAIGLIYPVPSPDGRHVVFPYWTRTTDAWLFRGM